MTTNRNNGGFAPFFNRKFAGLACAAALCLALAALGALTGCKEESKGPATPPPVPVGLGKAEVKDAQLLITAIGHVEAYNAVTIKPQVAGQIQKVHFKEGSFVSTGAPLFTIDRAPFEAALAQAKANLVRDQATLEQNKRDLARYETLVKENVISRSDYESILSKTETSEATVAYDRAAVDKARLDLGYCNITSPINGRTGQVLVDLGNIVKDNETSLVTVAQVEPIYVTFSVPEENLPAVKRFAAQHKLEVLADVESDGLPPARGALDFVDNQVSTTTGMITLKAVFENRDHVLWPGVYVNVSMLLENQKDRVLIPARAVQTGPNGRFVYVVKDDRSVEPRPVDIDRLMGEDAVVAKGLTGSETVVVDGQLRLYPGATIVDRALEKLNAGNSTQPAANATAKAGS